MRTPVLIAAAFVAGLAVSPLAHQAMTAANAQAPAAAAPLTPMLIDLSAIADADMAPGGNGDLRSKGLVTTDNATIAVQVGNVGKHFHANSDEIQYIIEGTGTAWLGDQQKPIRPGMMLIIPKGTAHGGTVPTTGRFKAIAIKIPPQQAGDTHFMN